METTMSGRPWRAIWFTAAVIIIGGVHLETIAQERGRAMRHPDGVIDVKAIAAANNNSTAVRGFTDQLVDRSLLAGGAPTIYQRVFDTEIAFRHNQHRGVSEQDAVDAINHYVSLLQLPEYMSTTHQQFHSFRKESRLFVRHYAGTDARDSSNAMGVMSPAEALYVINGLMTQKLYNPQYQVPPAQWDNEANQRAAQAQSEHAPPPRARLGKIRPEVQQLLSFVPMVRDASGPAVEGVHQFLDTLGFVR
jgi:hypothetical protein